jgi:hypothetical protein
VRRRPPAWAYLTALLLVGGAATPGEADRPEILSIAVPAHLAADRAAAARITFRARRANVVAVMRVVEDLDGARRMTSQRELGMVAAAFGREEGDLLVPLAFATPGRKRVVFTLLTDEREESDAASVEVEVAP